MIEILHPIVQHVLMLHCLACSGGGDAVAPSIGLAAGAAGVAGGLAAASGAGGGDAGTGDAGAGDAGAGDGSVPDAGPHFGPLLPPASAAQVSQWIGEASAVLLDTGQYTPAQLNPAAIALIISRESSNIPNNYNNWDSNWVNGIPSQGLMQVIPPVFSQWALPGYNTDIMDPVSNIIAGVRYAVATYGSLDNVPGVVQNRADGGYVGY